MKRWVVGVDGVSSSWVCIDKTSLVAGCMAVNLLSTPPAALLYSSSNIYISLPIQKSMFQFHTFQIARSVCTSPLSFFVLFWKRAATLHLVINTPGVSQTVCAHEARQSKPPRHVLSPAEWVSTTWKAQDTVVLRNDSQAQLVITTPANTWTNTKGPLCCSHPVMAPDSKCIYNTLSNLMSSAI